MKRSVIIRLVLSAVLFAGAYAVPAKWRFIAFLAAYVTVGYDVVWSGITHIFRGHVLDENFLMTVSSVAALCIKEYPEAVAILFFYQVGELFQSYAVARSRRSVADLMNLRPETVRVVRGSETVEVPPEEIEAGEVFEVRAGESVALDGTVVSGSGSVDTASVSGEAMPIDVAPGSTVVSGSVNRDGALGIRADKTYENSTVAKILELVEDAAERKAPSERFITRFSRVYTPVVVGLAVLIAAVPTVIWGNFTEWLRRAVTFLVVSCPCALVVSVPLAFFEGIGAASRKGILIKGGDFLEKLPKIKTVAFDKTGTLTKGSFSVKELCPAEGVSPEELALTLSSAERLSTHPVAAAFRGQPAADTADISDFRETGGKGVYARIAGEDCLAGKKEWLVENGVAVPGGSPSATAVYAAKTGRYLGYATLGDTVKPEARETVGRLNGAGLSTVMLTGDGEAAAREVAETVGVSRVKSGLLPQDKSAAVEELRGSGPVMFVGDGINDAPTLITADIGVSMGSLGSDAAVEASDIVIMNDDLSKIPEAFRLSRRTVRKVRVNIVGALAVKAAVLVLGALGLVGAPVAVFADVGVMILAVINALA